MAVNPTLLLMVREAMYPVWKNGQEVLRHRMEIIDPLPERVAAY